MQCRNGTSSSVLIFAMTDGPDIVYTLKSLDQLVDLYDGTVRGPINKHTSLKPQRCYFLGTIKTFKLPIGTEDIVNDFGSVSLI